MRTRQIPSFLLTGCIVCAIISDVPFAGCENLHILQPAADEVVVPDSGGRVTFVVHLPGWSIPSDGVLSLWLDGARVAVLCPDVVGSFEECSNVSERELDETVSLVSAGVNAGSHSIIVQVINPRNNAVLAHDSIRFLAATDMNSPPFALSGLRPKLQAIVFSKDRGCQLDLLLTSIEEMMGPADSIRTTVLFMATGHEYDKAYNATKKYHPNVHFIREVAGTFRQQLLQDIVRPDIPMTVMFVDDAVLVAPLAIDGVVVGKFMEEKDVMTFSMRLHPGVVHCYATNEDVPAPNLHDVGNGVYSWNWKDASADWAYPMSLDGHVFRTWEILPLLHSRPYHNPNTLEAALAAQPLPHPKCMCMSRPRLVNIPANRIQETYPNRFAGLNGVSTRALNVEFLLNRRLTLAHLRGLAPESVHSELPLIFGVGATEEAGRNEAETNFDYDQ